MSKPDKSIVIRKNAEVAIKKLQAESRRLYTVRDSLTNQKSAIDVKISEIDTVIDEIERILTDADKDGL